MMLAAFLLGLAGSFTHCVGMCTGVMLLLGRSRDVTGRRLLVLHGGRLTTYAVLGALAGALGQTLSAATGLRRHTAGGHDQGVALLGLAPWQGALALLAAAAAVYMALALLGRLPSPELLLIRVTRWWGRTARGLAQNWLVDQGQNWTSVIHTGATQPFSSEDASTPSASSGQALSGALLVLGKAQSKGASWRKALRCAHRHCTGRFVPVQVSTTASILRLRPQTTWPSLRRRWPPLSMLAFGAQREFWHLYLRGLFWGLLPCGLVLTGLLLAAGAGSPVGGGLTMLAFGLGTLPLGLGIGWTARQIRPGPRWAAWLRPTAAIIVLLFGAQMALRGLAAWGWVAHGSIGAMPLW